MEIRVTTARSGADKSALANRPSSIYLSARYIGNLDISSNGVTIMHRHFHRHREAFAAREFGFGHGRGGRGLHEHIRKRREGRVFDQGDLRFVILKLISEAPRHGYEIIKAIEEKVGGAYSPSPGVIYPTLTFSR